MFCAGFATQLVEEQAAARCAGDQLFRVVLARRMGGAESIVVVGRITSYNVCYTKLLRT